VGAIAVIATLWGSARAASAPPQRAWTQRAGFAPGANAECFAAGAKPVVVTHLDEESVPAAENPGAPVLDGSAPQTNPGPAADWERVPAGGEPVSPAKTEVTAPSAVSEGAAADGGTHTPSVAVGASAESADHRIKPATLPPAQASSEPASPVAVENGSTGVGAVKASARHGRVASVASAQSVPVAPVASAQHAPVVPAIEAGGTAQTASARTGDNAGANGTEAGSGAGGTGVGGAIGGTETGSAERGGAGVQTASLGPPPALDLGASRSGPDLSSMPLTGEFKKAATPARAAALRVTEQARVELAGGKTDDALRDLGRAVSIDPSNPFEYFYLGRVYIARGNYKQALAFLQRAEIGFAARPDWLGETVGFEGACDEELGQTTDGALAYRRALGSAPNNLRARVGLSRLGGYLPATATADESAATAPAEEAPPPPERAAAGPAPDEAAPPPPPAPAAPEGAAKKIPGADYQPD
jgi:hypothetical protein